MCGFPLHDLICVIVDPVLNPFRPGAGRRPPLLAGREDILAGFEVVRRLAEQVGEGDRGWVLYGLCGVGKTALLNELLEQVSARGWITAKVEATAEHGLAVRLAQALVRAMRTATGRHPEPRLRRLLAVFSAFSLKVDPSGTPSVGADIAPLTGVADSGRLDADLSALFEILADTARDLGIGVLILVDELQGAGAADLAALNTALHALGQTGRPGPLTFIGAGLPSLPALLAEATSYAERLYDYRPVGLLSAAAARDALLVPTQAQGVDWDPDALNAALDTARGYPYVLQAIGKHVWDLARTSPITVEDTAVGLAAARREVDDGLYRSRWERATPAQHDVLRALAALGGDESVSVAALAARTGKARTSDISSARLELIRKGLLYAPERGQLAFTVPGMHTFINTQP